MMISIWAPDGDSDSKDVWCPVMTVKSAIGMTVFGVVVTDADADNDDDDDEEAKMRWNRNTSS